MNTKYTYLIAAVAAARSLADKLGYSAAQIDAALDSDVEKLVGMINALRNGASIYDARRIAVPGVRVRLEHRRHERRNAHQLRLAASA